MRFCSIRHLQSAGPRSLATTNGVSVDFLSCRYLDVSVPYVRLFTLCIHVKIPLTRGVAPFGYPRIKDRSHLPAAFRKVLRPSSPLSAKASTKCSCLLVHSIRIYNSHRIHTSNTISLHAPFTAQAKYGFFRISIKLFSRLPGANARCFISVYGISMPQTFSSFLKTLKNHIFIQFFVRSYSLCLISPTSLLRK